MLKRIAEMIWGNFENWEEVQKFSLLGLIFFLIIGTYWAMRPIKDSIFTAIVGIDYQPMAKILSVIIVFPLVIGYSKLIDKFPRQRVFYILTTLYAIAALVFAWFFLDPVYGLVNTIKSPYRVLGWCWYVYVESFGSLIVALFWAFAVDITSEDSAKRGFPIISLFGQTGNIVGPLFLSAKQLGFKNSGPIVLIVAGMIFAMGLLMFLFMQVTPKSQFQSYGVVEKDKDKSEEPGFLEGLKLLLFQPYLLGIFLIITIYEIIITVFDFFFKKTAASAFPAEVDLSAYLQQYAVSTGVVATVCILLGINNIQRKLGMTASLVTMPLLVIVAIVVLKFRPELTVAFVIMVIAKAVNYALNQPTMKQLYIPTTHDARYKSQAWIEMFGGRLSKAAGSAINSTQKMFVTNYGTLTGIRMFLTLSSSISLGLVGVWLFVVFYVSRTYNKAVTEKQVVC